MNPKQPRTTREIFEAALELDPAARAAFVKNACGPNEVQRREVERLLAANDLPSPESWIDTDRTGPAMPAAAAKFAPGTKIGGYEILGVLGIGGMGEVYRARDLKLPTRQVAIKALPREFLHDPERVARFKREANVLASLNHPHIGAIHHTIEAAASQLLVLELVEGETLADWIARGPIPAREAMTIARQIAEALEYAHEAGIVHRDLKPANIKVTAEDYVKVLDFGLARVHHSEWVRGAVGSVEYVAEDSTESMSAPAQIMGTAAYMSPEQASGKDVDRRADIWAFGCLLYEMLSGNALFGGENVNGILAEVLKGAIHLERLPVSTPPGLRRLIARCLKRDRKQRLHHAGDARIEIEDCLNEEPFAPVPTLKAARLSRREAIAWTATATFGAISLASVVWPVKPNRAAGTPAGPPVPHEIGGFETPDPVSLAISPDGRKIVFSRVEGRRSFLWYQQAATWNDRGKARKLEATEGAYLPFWSPDSNWIGYFARFGLWKVAVNGGVPISLRDVSLGRGGSWNRNGDIVYAKNPGSAIYRTNADGKQEQLITELRPDKGHVSHRFPQFLDEYRFLYQITGKATGIYICDIRNKVSELLALERQGEIQTAVFAPPNTLLLLIEGKLHAQEFDLAKNSPVGGLRRLPVDDVMVNTAISHAALSASSVRSIVFRTGSAAGIRQLQWFNDRGDEGPKVGGLNRQGPLDPSLSSDGNRAMVDQAGPNDTGIYWFDTAKADAQENRFADEARQQEYSPVWSPDPDRSRIVFSSNADGPWDLYEQSEGGTRRKILATNQSKFATDWSRDLQQIVYRTINPEGGYDLCAFKYDPQRTVGADTEITVRRSKDFEERDGQFSPDGKWIAYQSNDSNKGRRQFEIFLLPFPPDADRSVPIPVSESGGAQARWGRTTEGNTTELFYIDPDWWLWVAYVQFLPGGRVRIEKRERKFQTKIWPENPTGAYSQQYAVANRSGHRFLMNSSLPEGPPPIQWIVDLDI